MDATDRGLFAATPCRCVKHHSPRPHVVEQHHVFPAAVQRHLLGRVVDPTTIPLCGNGHNLVHAIIDAALRGHPAPRANAYLRGIAATGLAAIRAAGGGRDLSEVDVLQGPD